MTARPGHRTATTTTVALLKVAAAWYVLGAVASLAYASVKGEGVGSFIYVIWGIAVSFCGTLSHGLLIYSKWFCRSIGLVQVFSITGLRPRKWVVRPLSRHRGQAASSLYWRSTYAT